MRTEFTTPCDTDIVAVRRFAAPAALLWAAHTEPEHVRRWLGQPHSPMVDCEIDLRVGGTYRYTWSLPDGSSFGFHGRYVEIDAPHRLVSTESYAPQAGDVPSPEHPVAEALNTLTLVEDAHGTLLTLVMHYPSREVRDGVLATGMAGGLDACLTGLEALLAQGLVPA